MGQIAGTTFGIGSGYQGSPFAQQTYLQPFSPYTSLQPLSAQAGYGGAGAWPLNQIAQVLQIVPQQLQQLQLLQQQQLAYIQQLLQVVPAQLHQLQQLIQIVPQQVQQLQQQQWQPFGQSLQGPFGFGLVPQAFGGQPASHVM